MKIAVRFHTRSGNTEKLAHAIGKAVEIPAENVTVPLSEKTELVFLGASVYAADADAPVKRFLKENAEKIGTLVVFGTGAVLPSAYKQVKKLAASYGIPVSDTEFHCRGYFGTLHIKHPDENDLAAAADFARAVIAAVH